MESLRCLSKEALILLHKNRTLLPLIKSELIQSKLAEVTLKDDLINKLEEQLINKLGLQKSEDYESWLKANMLTKEQFKILATNDFRLKQYCHEQFGHKVEARFLDRKQELDIIIYSLIRVKDFFKARELYYRIIGKESDFGDLSTMYSEGIEQRTRGIVGPGPMARIHPKLAEHLKNSTNGEVQSPIEIDGNHLITRVESYDPAQLDDYMRGKMEEELFNIWIENQASKVIKNLMSQDLIKTTDNIGVIS